MALEEHERQGAFYKTPQVLHFAAAFDPTASTTLVVTPDTTNHPQEKETRSLSKPTTKPLPNSTPNHAHATPFASEFTFRGKVSVRENNNSGQTRTNFLARRALTSAKFLRSASRLHVLRLPLRAFNYQVKRSLASIF